MRSYTVPGTRHCKSFCPTCGAAVPRVEEGMLVVPAGSLDSPLTMTPNAHICGADRAEWDWQLETVPTLYGLPGQ